MKVRAILPTRGLIYARTVIGLLSNKEPYFDPSDTVIVTEKPMPDCWNDALIEVLQDEDVTHIWMVEEDNELPEGVLRAMVAQNKPIVTVDYPVAKGVSHIHRNDSREILWCGIGNTLIAREVFEFVGYPWFEVDKVTDYKTGEVRQLPEHKVACSFGGHDVLFFTKARSSYDIFQLAGWRGQHFRASEIQKKETNNGYYHISSL